MIGGNIGWYSTQNRKIILSYCATMHKILESNDVLMTLVGNASIVLIYAGVCFGFWGEISIDIYT